MANTFTYGDVSVTVRALSTGWDRNNYLRLYYDILKAVTETDREDIRNIANSYVELYVNAVLFTTETKNLNWLMPAKGAPVSKHLEALHGFMSLPYALLDAWQQALTDVNDAVLNEAELLPPEALTDDQKKDTARSA